MAKKPQDGPILRLPDEVGPKLSKVAQQVGTSRGELVRAMLAWWRQAKASDRNKALGRAKQ